MDKIDLTQYTDNELSLVVYNDSGLYSMRHDSDLISELEEVFTFTPCQLLVLLDDLKGELECI